LHPPLRAMDGFSRILLEDYAPQLPPEAQPHLRIIRENANQMGRLINGLLAFSRLSRQPLNKRSIED
jgi:signal transduction histidine kinase